MKPTALVLNILVASIAIARYARAGACAWAVLQPFLLGSVPLAALGGALPLPGAFYRPVVAALLLLAAARLLRPTAATRPADAAVAPVPVGPAVAAGAGIVLLADIYDRARP